MVYASINQLAKVERGSMTITLVANPLMEVGCLRHLHPVTKAEKITENKIIWLCKYINQCKRLKQCCLY